MLKQFLIGAIAPICLTFLIPNAAIAESTRPTSRKLTLSVYPLNSNATKAICPNEILLTETPRPYQEGSYTTDGVATLGWLTRAFQIERHDDFSVTWVAKLQPKYANCRASAKISKIDDEDFARHSYLRMRLINQKAYLILDMTGMQDANDFTTVILQKGVKSGNPTWTWGGTD